MIFNFFRNISGKFQLSRRHFLAPEHESSSLHHQYQIGLISRESFGSERKFFLLFWLILLHFHNLSSVNMRIRDAATTDLSSECGENFVNIGDVFQLFVPFDVKRTLRHEFNVDYRSSASKFMKKVFRIR